MTNVIASLGHLRLLMSTLVCGTTELFLPELASVKDEYCFVFTCQILSPLFTKFMFVKTLMED